MYSVAQRKDIPYSIEAINADQKYCTALHFTDVKNHSDINLLPSWHPYWRFRVYLRLKANYVSKIKTIRQYEYLLSNDPDNILDDKKTAQILSQIDTLKYELKYKQYQEVFSQL